MCQFENPLITVFTFKFSNSSFSNVNNGGLAQLIEHLLCTQGVNGLNPLSSTKIDR